MEEVKYDHLNALRGALMREQIDLRQGPLWRRSRCQREIARLKAQIAQVETQRALRREAQR